MNLYKLFILGINIKYIPFCILYMCINDPMAFKEYFGICLTLVIYLYYNYTLFLVRFR